MEKILKSTVKIRFQDCDPFNHLNNAKYIDYFLNAREDQILEHYAMAVFGSEETSWMVSSNQVSYIRPANILEEVVIESMLLEYTNKTLLVEMKMWNNSETELKAIQWTKFIHINRVTKRLAIHTEAHMELFKSIVFPVEQNFFEERCSAVLKDFRARQRTT